MTSKKKVVLRISNRENSISGGAEILGPVRNEFNFLGRSPCDMKVESFDFKIEPLPPEGYHAFLSVGDKKIKIEDNNIKNIILNKGQFVSVCFEGLKEDAEYFHLHLFSDVNL